MNATNWEFEGVRQIQLLLFNVNEQFSAIYKGI